MITPIEIQSKTFKSGGLGYDKKDVDAFYREVLRSYETIYRENMELNDKVNVLTEGIQYYKTIEKTLQKALVLAEKTAEDTKIAAVEKAKNIEREARTRSQLIVADAKNELEHIHNQTIQLLQQYEKYKAQFKNLAKAQMEMIESDAFKMNIARIDTFAVDSDIKKTESQSKENHQQKNNSKEKPVEKDKNVKAKPSMKEQKSMAEQEAAATIDSKNDDFTVEFDTSFMDSYDDIKDKTLDYDQTSKADDIEDEMDQAEPELTKQDEFSFINLVDDED